MSADELNLVCRIAKVAMEAFGIAHDSRGQTQTPLLRAAAAEALIHLQTLQTALTELARPTAAESPP